METERCIYVHIHAYIHTCRKKRKRKETIRKERVVENEQENV